MEEVAPNMFLLGDIEWDLSISHPGGILEFISALRTENRRIFRAFASLGALVDSAIEPITRSNSPENEYDFCPHTLSIEVGPIELHSLGCDAQALVGWIGVSLSGDGYLFPWTFREVIGQLESTPEIQRITEACRAFWPVPLKPVEERIASMRKQIGVLWPYDDYDKPWDWYWGLQETG